MSWYFDVLSDMPYKQTTKNNKLTEVVKREFQNTQGDLNEITAYLSDFLDFLPLAVCDVSLAGIVKNIDNAFKELSGFVTTELKGEYLSTFFSETKKVEDLLKQTLDKGVVKNQELTLVTKEGRKVPVSVSLSAKKDDQGNLIRYFVSITDISALKELQKESDERIKVRTKDLEESRRALLNILEDTEDAKHRVEIEKDKTQSIFDNFIDGLLIFDSKGALESINLAAEKFLEIKQKNFLGKKWNQLKKELRLMELIKIVKEGQQEVFRKEFFKEEGGLVLEATSKFVLSGKKKVAFLIIIHDISRERTIERLKSQFVSVAAHQLRTPLSIIKWSLSMLIEGELGNLTPEQKEMLLKTDQTNERMIRLINDLLNVARIEEGRFIYRPKTVDFVELLEPVIESLKLVAQKKKVNFEINISMAKGSKVIKADIEKLSLAVKNLVENALFYTKAGGIVTISVKRQKDQVEFSVQDTGIGIPENQQGRVFTKFFRGDNAIRTETEGTGLGLFIAKNIIEAHGGKIEFQSKEDKGTTFSFYLPAIG